ncbi:MAG: hypothetical protein Q8O67_00590 [Deltaproteobacteria bacterium]|nr:hypothetical protein [Deltaproteobacteria bacterium]
MNRLLLCVLFVVACEPLKDPPLVVADCESDDQCAAGNLCIAGTCLLAECDPDIEDQCGADVVDDRDPACCRAIENCDEATLKCVRDPAADDVVCLESADCYERFTTESLCSLGRCVSSETLVGCAQDNQCEAGERCDVVELFCLPDACQRCADFPETCCTGAELCNVDDGLCVDPGTVECTVVTEVEDCRPGEICDPRGRCVQCVDDDGCGPGLTCDLDVGLCVSANRCETDDACTVLNPLLRCINNTCTRPECDDVDVLCPDARETCENFICVLAPPVCPAEDDEPNNSAGQAVPLVDVSAAYEGSLCRGDVDFLSFPVLPQKRYTVTITATSAAGITATLFDTSNQAESSAQFGSSASVELIGISGPAESGRFTLQLSSASATSLDAWSYSVEWREGEASPQADCSAAAQLNQEPNEDFSTATTIALGATTSFTRCTLDDADVFHLTVPALTGVEVTIDGYLDVEGQLVAELFSGPSAGQLIRSVGSANDAITSVVVEGPSELFIKITVARFFDALPDQTYRVSTRAIARPAACDGDVENDGEQSLAQALPTTTTNGLIAGSIAGLRCNGPDLDHAGFTLPAGLGGALRLSFAHDEGDLVLDLFDRDSGDLLAVSNVSSSSSGVESVDVPPLDVDRDYVARVRLPGVSSPGVEAQAWALSLATFDAALCLASEPALDNTFASARCLGDFDEGAFPCNGARLASPLVSTLEDCVDAVGDGCGHICGDTDFDVVRLGTIESGRTITATLRFDPALGDSSLQLAKVTGSTPSVVVIRRDDDVDGVVSLVFETVGAPKEHMLTVKPEGRSGHLAQLWALSVDVGGPCLADANEGANGNGTPATATQLRADPQPLQADELVNASVCGADVDVFALLGLDEEELTFRVSGPLGLVLGVGTAPPNLNDPAIPLPDAEVIIDASGAATLTIVSSRVQQLFVTINGVDDGDYALTIDYSPGL